MCAGERQIKRGKFKGPAPWGSFYETSVLEHIAIFLLKERNILLNFGLPILTKEVQHQVDLLGFWRPHVFECFTLLFRYYSRTHQKEK